MGQYVEQGYQFDLTAPQINDVLLMVKKNGLPNKNFINNSRFLIKQHRYKNITSSSIFTSAEIASSDTIVKFPYDRWKVSNKTAAHIKITGINNASTFQGGSIKIEPSTTLSDGENPYITQRIYDACKGSGDGELFDNDVTISILTKEYGLITVTGHTATRSDYYDAVLDADNNPTVTIGTDIIAKLPGYDADTDWFAKLTCTMDAVSRYRRCYAFSLMISAKVPVTIYAVKVEIGTEQTLVRVNGTKYTIIDMYDYDTDFNICKKFYRIVSFGGYGRFAAWSGAGKGNYAITINVDIHDMAENPSIDYFYWDGYTSFDPKICNITKSTLTGSTTYKQMNGMLNTNKSHFILYYVEMGMGFVTFIASTTAEGSPNLDISHGDEYVVHRQESNVANMNSTAAFSAEI